MDNVNNEIKGDYEKCEMHLPAEELLEMAKEDIAAILWLGGVCQFCKYSHREEYFGAIRYDCAREGGAANCRPVWRYDNG